MNQIKLNKNFYVKSSLDRAIKDFKEIFEVAEDEKYYLVSSENKTTLLEFSNYLFSINEK